MSGSLTIQVIILATFIVSTILYVVFHNIAFKNFFKKFKQVARQRYGFYECGFRARIEKSTLVQIHVIVIFSMVLLYDVEGLFLLFLMANTLTLSIVDLLFIFYYIGLLIIGVLFDISRGVTNWQNL